VASHPIYKNGLDSLFHVRGLHDTLGKLNELQLGKSGRTQVGLVGGLHAQTQVISDGNGRSLRTIEIWWIFNCHAIMFRSVVSCNLKTDLSFHNPGVDKLLQSMNIRFRMWIWTPVWRLEFAERCQTLCFLLYESIDSASHTPF